MNETTTTTTTSSTIIDPIVQYIAMRSDLKWPKGALIAQCCHSSVAAIHQNYADEQTIEYLNKLDSMHKIVVAVLNETDLISLSKQLNENEIKHKLWTEQPENYATCLATKPYNKSLVEKFFKAFKLFK
jgi:peptidyl-tRNA hydrolase